MTNIMRGQASSLGTLNKATKAGWLPVINGQRYTINIIVVLVLTFAMYAYLKYSKQGYEISVVGESENTARYAGINVSRVMIRTMLLSVPSAACAAFWLWPVRTRRSPLPRQAATASPPLLWPGWQSSTPSI